MGKTKVRKKAEAGRREFSKKLIIDIHNVCQKRQNLKHKYGQARDGELIEAIIYEEMALGSRYNYLMRLARENDVTLDKKCFFLDWSVDN